MKPPAVLLKPCSFTVTAVVIATIAATTSRLARVKRTALSGAYALAARQVAHRRRRRARHAWVVKSKSEYFFKERTRGVYDTLFQIRNEAPQLQPLHTARSEMMYGVW